MILVGRTSEGCTHMPKGIVDKEQKLTKPLKSSVLNSCNTKATESWQYKTKQTCSASVVQS